MHESSHDRFSDPVASNELLKEFQKVLEVAKHHQQFENQTVVPYLDKHMSALSADLKRVHHEEEAETEVLKEIMSKLSSESDPFNRLGLGESLTRRMELFNIHTLMHMNLEETDIMCNMWQNLDDAALIDMLRINIMV